MKSKSLLRAAASTAIALIAAGSANALTINLIDEGGVKGSKAEQGFRIAADYWESVLSNNVTLNFGVSYAALPANVIGSTGSTAMDYSVANWEAGVNATKNAASSIDSHIVLPTLTNGAIKMITSGARTNGGNGVSTTASKRVYDTDTSGSKSTNNKILYLNTANVKAIGGTAVYDASNPDHLDADITFSSDFGFDFDPTDGTTAHTFDFIGTAIHEMGHALGFVSGVDDYDYVAKYPSAYSGNMNNTSWFSALDMFRYTTGNTVAGAPGTALNEAVGAPAYFSTNGGATQFGGSALFSTGSYFGDGQQASHWKDTNSCTVQLGIMDPTECYGQRDYVTGLDLAAMDAIGWNLSFDVGLHPTYSRTTASIYSTLVPEPSSWAMMVAGFGLVGGAMRRRSARVSFAR